MKILPRQAQAGFSLFELVLALSIASAVITSIFLIADSAIRSSTTMIDAQTEDLERDAFFGLLKRQFGSLSGDSILNLASTSTSEPFLSEMTFQNAPVSFQWGGRPISAEAVRIVTVPTVTRGVDVVIEYFDQQILDSEETTAERGIEPIASIKLLEDVRLFEWSLMDGRQIANVERDQWPWEWDQPARLPNFVELKVVFQNDTPTVSRLYFIPTKIRARTAINAVVQAARGAAGNTGGGDSDNNGGGSPDESGGETP